MQEIILDEDGYSYWKKTWDGDNVFFMDSGSIKEPIDAADHFWGTKVQDLYIGKYGEPTSPAIESPNIRSGMIA